MKKSIRKNYLYNVVYQLLVIAIPIITTPYLSRVLGPEGIGKYSFSYSVVSYFIMLAVLGTYTYAQREIAFFRDNKKRISQIFCEVFLFRLFTTLLCLFLYLAFVLIVYGNSLLFWIQSLYIVAVCLDISWFFQGLEEFKTIVFRNLVLKIFNLIYILTCIKEPADLNKYVIGLVLFQILGNMILWPYISRYISIIGLKKLHPLSHLKQILELFVPTIAVQLYLVIDKIMIGIFSVGDLENGYYEQSEKIVKIGLTIATAMGTVVVPRVAYIFENEDKEKLRKVIYKSLRFSLFLTIPMCCGLITLAETLVPWFLGDSFTKCIGLIKILGPIIIAIGLSNVFGTQYLVPTKRQKVFTITVSIGALTNFVMNLILVPRFYSVGAALATVCAETIVTLLQLIYVVFIQKLFNIKTIFISSVKNIISCVPMCIILNLLKSRMETSIVSIFILVLIGMSVYFLCLYILKDDFFTSLFKRIKPWKR